MLTIPDTMRTISRDIQNTFEELVKILLRKSLHPTLNPLRQNTKVIYNTFRGKYERGFIGSSPDDNINKYTYTIINESLGWNDEVLVNFKIMAKFIKNSSTPLRFPADLANIHNKIKSKSKVAFSEKEGKQHAMTGRTLISTQYKNFLTYLTSKSMNNVIANKQASFTYTTDIPYTHAFKQLESIGKDIIDQTDPSIFGDDSAKMSTAMLRVKLYNLEQDLANLSVDHPNIYDAYVEMLRIINSVPKIKMVWIIKLIAALSYQRWEDLSENLQKTYLDILGEEFIQSFNSNELITILLQSNSSEVILTSAYLYPLLKMLFIVFGYSKLIPVISEKCGDSQVIIKERLRKYLDKHRGASFRRGDTHNIYYQEPVVYENDIYESPFNTSVRKSDNNENNITNDIFSTNLCKSDALPIDQCIYEFIKLFGDLYPTIIGLMGGTEKFPPESIEISCDDIPPTYDLLTTLPEYLWRYNDFSYCRYLEYVGSKQIVNALNSKINSKARYLHSV